MAKEHRFASTIPQVPRKLRVGQFSLATIHRKGGSSKGYGFRVPPTQPDFLPLVTIFVKEMDSLGQTLLRAFQEYFDGGMGGCSVTIGLTDS
ncbi:hypothetical protein AOQ71_01370 [Bradyrhizobium manausense]|uniref:Uncharacterized protein n=1 Tax=Bradyrhizobium manausense TaxID=989370 RepID=A0A0R3EEC3_9BRAD|nr:hypothetical protein AOQ71_01370 [Bradyrhizobium manausense]